MAYKFGGLPKYLLSGMTILQVADFHDWQVPWSWKQGNMSALGFQHWARRNQTWRFGGRKTLGLTVEGTGNKREGSP